MRSKHSLTSKFNSPLEPPRRSYYFAHQPPLAARSRRVPRNVLDFPAGGVLGDVEVVAVLQVEPEPRRDAEVARQPEGRIAADAAAATHDLGDAVRRHAQDVPQLGRAQVKRRHEVLLEDLAGMDGREFPGHRPS